jgi:hypothetical protein
MISVTVSQIPVGKVKQLDAVQSAEFNAELWRVKIYWWLTLARGRPRPRVSPEIMIEMNKNGRITSYELYGGQVLYDTRTGQRFRFYMGHLLTFWLLT